VELSFELPSPADTDALGAALAQSRPAGPLVAWLRGDLGAGKSTLARARFRARGVAGANSSPTYTLVERYPLSEGEAVHLDLYRIGAPGELDFLGLDDLRAEASLWLVEWPERGGAAVPPPEQDISLPQAGARPRAEQRENSEKGPRWLAALSKTGPSSASV
jgi:tRNA threonylcarbamoyladenosine biosynthesis protein TsaE